MWISWTEPLCKLGDLIDEAFVATAAKRRRTNYRVHRLAKVATQYETRRSPVWLTQWHESTKN